MNSSQDNLWLTNEKMSFFFNLRVIPGHVTYKLYVNTTICSVDLFWASAFKKSHKTKKECFSYPLKWLKRELVALK